MSKLSQREHRKVTAFLLALSNAVPQNGELSKRVHSQLESDASVRQALWYLDSSKCHAATDRGKETLAALREALENLYGQPTSFMEAFAVLDTRVSQADSLIKESKAREQTGGIPDLIEGQRVSSVGQGASKEFSATCFLLASLYGASSLTGLRDSVMESLSDATTEIPRKIKAALDEASRRRALGVWTIRRQRHRPSRVLPGASSMSLTWHRASLESIVSGGSYRQLGPMLFQSTDENSEIFLAGRGYIVGTGLDRPERLRAAGVHTELPIDAFAAVSGSNPSITAQLSKYFNGDDVYCLHPRDVTAALDRQIRIAEYVSWRSR